MLASKDFMKDLLAGLFLLVGLGLFALSIVILGRERNLFGEFYTYQSYFSDVRGLNIGAPVRLGGISIGRVSQITFSQLPEDARIAVSVEIQDRFADRITNASVASIETQGLLGDKFISLGTQLPTVVAGQPAPIIAPLAVNAVLPSKEGGDLNSLIGRVDGLANAAEGGVSSFSRLTNGIDVAKINASLDAITNVTNKFAGSTIVEDINAITSSVRNGDGILHKMVFTQGLGAEVGRLVETLARAANDIEKVTGALSSGSGTLGALLVDSKVYDNLVAVTDDAKRSVVLRSVVRSALNSPNRDSEEQKASIATTSER